MRNIIFCRPDKVKIAKSLSYMPKLKKVECCSTSIVQRLIKKYFQVTTSGFFCPMDNRQVECLFHDLVTKTFPDKHPVHYRRQNIISNKWSVGTSLRVKMTPEAHFPYEMECYIQ